MEYYESKCPDCGAHYKWVGYKTGIGKTEAQLAQMHRDRTVCRKCGSTKLKTDLDMSDEANAGVNLVAGLLFGKGEKKEEKPKTPEVSKEEREIREFCFDFGDGEDDLLLADGFEQAFIGIAHRCSKPNLACYDYERAVEVLMKRDGMTDEEAREYLNFNCLGAWMGEGTPLWLSPFPGRDRPVSFPKGKKG